ncbi:hypothetical protein ACFVAD_18930 [Sutcliffiella sp. NPDC057660]|uniref:hypothetical protein n=1 Tax=Sutcliffiella sp. NPDC057660 TaxID=3346199 RepID=UPI0036A63A9B
MRKTALVYLDNPVDSKRVIDSFEKLKDLDEGYKVEFSIEITSSEKEFYNLINKDFDLYVIEKEPLVTPLKGREGVVVLIADGGKQFPPEENAHRVANIQEFAGWLFIENLSNYKSVTNSQNKSEPRKQDRKPTNIFHSDNGSESEKDKASKKQDKENTTTVKPSVDTKKIAPSLVEEEQRDKVNLTPNNDTDTDTESIVHQVKQEGSELEDEVALRAREIRKKTFHRTSLDNNKTIGVWAPLHRAGVTTFILNYALYLGSQKFQCCVIEGLNENQLLKNFLKRYNPEPEHWTSYARALHTNGLNSDHIMWSYKSVLWFPLDDRDIHLEWDYHRLYHYINSVKYFDIVLVDLPTGKMEDFTLHTLEHLDELWVIGDDSFHQNVAWKKYIHQIAEENNLNVSLIFNKKYSFSQEKILAEKLELPLLASLPPLHEVLQRNSYESKPITENKEVLESLLVPFEDLTKHLVGSDFVHNNNKRNFLINSLTSLQKALQGKKKHGII